ncbi:MAG: glycosyltransferase family 39 protein [Candidatus Doudnabacteria bacterium]|nr:glycosyltransferase family 39 protein [Candidatus Doudnabacteria bacterium]
MKKILATCGILLFGLLLRLYHNTDISLWHDEAFSALLIKYPWGEMFYRIGLDVHPPVYYVALRVWSMFVGDSLLALRGFSIFFGLGTAYMAFRFVKDIVQNERAAFLALLAIALNPFQIQYATEARMYTFGAFLAVSAAYALCRGLQNTGKQQWRWMLGFGALSALAALTHYYLLFTVAALGFYALVSFWLIHRTQVRAYGPLAAAYAIIIATFIPWTSWFVYQYKQVGAGYWIPPLDNWSIPTTLWQLFTGMEVDIHKVSSQVGVIAVSIGIVSALSIFAIRSKAAHKWLVLLLSAAPFLGALAFALLAHLKGQDSSVYLVRYFLYASAFLFIGLSLSLDMLKQSRIVFAGMLLYLCVCVLVFTNYWHKLDITHKPGMRAAVEYLQSHTYPNDKLFVGSSFEFFNLKYYLSQVAPPQPTPAPATMSSGQFSLEDLSDDAQTAHPIPPTRGWPKPLLFSGGNTSIRNLPHFAGTAILTDADLLPRFEDGAGPGDTVWVLWTNSFGGSKPATPKDWKQVDEAGFAEVRPYVGTWIIITKYLVQ